MEPMTALRLVKLPKVMTEEMIEAMNIEELRLFARRLQAENVAMRPIVLRMAEARICRNSVTMVESCPQCDAGKQQRWIVRVQPVERAA